jgi:hypothetical protein
MVVDYRDSKSVKPKDGGAVLLVEATVSTWRRLDD